MREVVAVCASFVVAVGVVSSWCVVCVVIVIGVVDTDVVVCLCSVVVDVVCVYVGFLVVCCCVGGGGTTGVGTFVVDVLCVWLRVSCWCV